MAVTISDNYQVKYTNKWGVLLQQKVSALEKLVTVDRDCKGEVKFIDQYGVLDFKEKTTRMGSTTLDEAPTLRRSMRPRIFTKAVGFDEFDATKLGDLDLPVSKTLEGLRMAANRKMDDVMIAAFLGQNFVGKDGTTAVAFPADRVVAKDYVESGTKAASGLTLAKLRRTLQMFQEADAWTEDSAAAGDQLVFACSSAQILNLLSTTEVTSYDYNSVKALVDGKVDTFMGFKFVRTERLPKSEGVRECLAWVKSRAQFGLWNDFKVKISVRDDLDEALQIRAKFACGATRLEEKGFVKVLCAQ